MWKLVRQLDQLAWIGCSLVVLSTIVASACVIAVLAAYLWPFRGAWCSDQIAAWGGVAATLGALAMAGTAWLILRQVSLQNRQLVYYYQPGINLQVSTDPEHKRRDGVRLWVSTANQATVFKVELALDEFNWDQPLKEMVASQADDTSLGAGRQEPKVPSQAGDTALDAGRQWSTPVVEANHLMWVTVGPFGVLAGRRRALLVVDWQHVTGEYWRQEWWLKRASAEGKPEDANWFVKIKSAPRPYRRSDR